jgi:hypothetical protein
MTDPGTSYPPPRITAAREFLDYACRSKVTDLPPTVLTRECAELRNQLRAVLGAATRTPAQQATLTQALADAARYREDRSADGCSHPAATEASTCPACTIERGQAARYLELARQLRATPGRGGCDGCEVASAAA